jgi:6-phosphogluconolactonase/glucosamine-6-phosphate isomerase/deaminase
MELIACKTSEEMTERAHLWCESRIKTYGAHAIFLPAGKTPTLLYQLWEARRPAYLDARMRLLQVDDVLTGEQAGVFRAYFESSLPSFRSRLRPIRDADERADLAILGFGLNGHIAFHEPGLPFNFHSGCVRLSHDTKDVLGIERDAETWGITYGLHAFLQAKAILLMVSGEKKKQMFRRFLDSGEVDAIPATGLKRHPDLTILTDFNW